MSESATDKTYRAVVRMCEEAGLPRPARKDFADVPERLPSEEGEPGVLKGYGQPVDPKTIGYDEPAVVTMRDRMAGAMHSAGAPFASGVSPVPDQGTRQGGPGGLSPQQLALLERITGGGDDAA